MNRPSLSIPVVSETPVTPLYPAVEAKPPVPQAPPRRVAVIEPGVGNFRVVYRDEHGYPLLDWPCDCRVDAEWRQTVLKLAQRIGDSLPSTTARATPFPLPLPRLLR